MKPQPEEQTLSPKEAELLQEFETILEKQLHIDRMGDRVSVRHAARNVWIKNGIPQGVGYEYEVFPSAVAYYDGYLSLFYLFFTLIRMDVDDAEAMLHDDCFPRFYTIAWNKNNTYYYKEVEKDIQVFNLVDSARNRAIYGQFNKIFLCVKLINFVTYWAQQNGKINQSSNLWEKQAQYYESTNKYSLARECHCVACRFKGLSNKEIYDAVIRGDADEANKNAFVSKKIKKALVDHPELPVPPKK